MVRLHLGERAQLLRHAAEHRPDCLRARHQRRARLRGRVAPALGEPPGREFNENEQITFKRGEARSGMYRRRLLQPNTHFAAIFGVNLLYTICKPLHRSEFKNSVNVVKLLRE